MLGRNIRVGRPQHYIPAPNGENPPLDVQPLRERGLISPIEEPEVGKAWGKTWGKPGLELGQWLTPIFANALE